MVGSRLNPPKELKRGCWTELLQYGARGPQYLPASLGQLAFNPDLTAVVK